MTQISITSFVENEIKQFSLINSIRGIPLLTDGLKPSQRKVLYAGINGKKEFLEADRFAALAAAMTHYHQGSQNLEEVVTNMTMGWVGKNNIPFFVGEGQFGSIVKPKASAARYVSVQINPVMLEIYNPADNGILEYNKAAGVEPKSFLPVIPIGIVNGMNGIGSGYSVSTPNHNPLDVIKSLKMLLRDEMPPKLQPWYKGFKGKSYYDADGRVVLEGIYEKINATTLRITELPVGWSVEKYKDTVLQPLLKSDVIQDYSDDTVEEGWDITVYFKRGGMSSLSEAEIIKMFRLTSAWKPTIAVWNAEGFLSNDYPDINELLLEFFFYRLHKYSERKTWLLADMDKKRTNLLRKKDFVIFMTHADKNLNISDLRQIFMHNHPDITNEGEIDDLFRMPISSVTKDSRDRLQSQIEKITKGIETLTNTEPEKLFLDDLNKIESLL